MLVSCPQCTQHESVQKVSDTFSYHANSTATPENYQISSENEIVTSRLDHLSPPAEPTKISRKSSWSYLFGGACILYGLIDPKFIGPVFWLSAGFGFILAGYSADKEFREYCNKFQEWEKSMHLWNQLYYCSNCNTTFNPSDQRMFPASSNQSFLAELSSCNNQKTKSSPIGGFNLQKNHVIAILLIIIVGWYLLFNRISVEGNYRKVPFPGHFIYTTTYYELNFKDGKVEISGVYGKYNYEIKGDTLIMHLYSEDVPFKILENGKILENRDSYYLGRYKRQ